MSEGVLMGHLATELSVLKPHTPLGSPKTSAKPIPALVQMQLRPGDGTGGVATALPNESESSLRLRGVEVQDGGGFLPAVKQRFEQVPHGFQSIIVEQGSHLLPKQPFAPPLRPSRLEQGATELLDLID